MLGNFACFFFLLSEDFFFKINYLKKNLSGIPSECQTVWIQIRPDVLSGLIWVQTVCKGYQQMTKVATSGKEFKPPLQPASVAQLDAPSDWRPGGRGFNPRRGRQHSFVEIDHEIFSMVILSLPLIQEGQLSVSGKRMCTILVNRLED